jgi:hypothetical protein
MNVSDPNFRRETRIDGSAARSGAIEFWTRVIGIDQILGLQTEALKVPIEQRRVHIRVQ